MSHPIFAARAWEKYDRYLSPQVPHFFGSAIWVHTTHANGFPSLCPLQRNLQYNFWIRARIPLRIDANDIQYTSVAS